MTWWVLTFIGGGLLGAALVYLGLAVAFARGMR